MHPTTSRRAVLRVPLTLGLLALAACWPPKQIDEVPIMKNGDRVASNDSIIADARRTADADRLRQLQASDTLSAIALRDCAPAVCDAIARGEVALGMTPVQVMAATRTTENAWLIRSSSGVTVMSPGNRDMPPRDVVGPLAVVQVGSGGVSTYSYREREGLRVVSAPGDASATARASSLAEGLIRQGDNLAANGQFAAALDYYDRASLLVPANAEIDYKIATSLDKLLRPIEAALQYRLFLHKLELQKIDAVGTANARLAEAIALAQQRIIVLERQSR